MSLKFSQQYYDDLSSKYKDDIITSYKEGKSMREISKQYGVRLDTIKRRLLQWKVKLRNPKKLREEKLEANKWNIIQQYMTGSSATKIAGRLRTDIKAIAKKLREWGYYDQNKTNRINNFRKYNLQKEQYKKKKVQRIK